MKNNRMFWLLSMGGALALLLLTSFTTTGSMLDTAAELIASFEGFVDHPYWDVKRYSWGYGTAAPGASGYISEQDALQELASHVQDDYNYLSQLITYPLNKNQWAAYLSFSYNEGQGNADNLVNNINTANWDALRSQWQLYNKVNSNVYSQNLADRREKELQVFFS